jgi:hypothetical protein
LRMEDRGWKMAVAILDLLSSILDLLQYVPLCQKSERPWPSIP